MQARTDIFKVAAYMSAVSGAATARFNFLDPGSLRPPGAGFTPAKRKWSLGFIIFEETIMTCFRTQKAMTHATLLFCFLIFLSLFVLLPNRADATQPMQSSLSAVEQSETTVTAPRTR